MPASCRANSSVSPGFSSRFARAAIVATRSRVNSRLDEGAGDGEGVERSEGTANASMLGWMKSLRRAAVAGSWYPGSAAALEAAVDAHLARARTHHLDADVVALVAPHAGLMYSGPVAAHAYGLLRGRSFDVAILVGPSHFMPFDGVAAYAE